VDLDKIGIEMQADRPAAEATAVPGVAGSPAQPSENDDAMKAIQDSIARDKK
jgi:hypothetical protein